MPKHTHRASLQNLVGNLGFMAFKDISVQSLADHQANWAEALVAKRQGIQNVPNLPSKVPKQIASINMYVTTNGN